MFRTMVITASIVTYNTDVNELASCLQSLVNGGVSTIYVCDNSPTAQLREFCQSCASVEYIFNNANLGYGAGHNVAIRRSLQRVADYHLVINSDVYFGDGVIERIVAYMVKTAMWRSLFLMWSIPMAACSMCAGCCPRPPT